MFPRRNRVSREHFPSALRGRRLSSEHMSVVVPEKASGYAVVVSKKVARLSVTRHRIKRQIMGALRTLSPLPPGLIVFPKPSAVRLDAGHLRGELTLLLSKIR